MMGKQIALLLGLMWLNPSIVLGKSPDRDSMRLGSQARNEIVKPLMQMIKRFSDAGQREESVRNFLEDQFNQKKYRAIQEASTLLLEKPEVIGDEQLKLLFSSYLRSSRWEYAQNLRKAGDMLATKILQQFQETFPNDELADVALVQAFELYVAKGNGAGATAVGSKLVNTYLDSSFRKGTLLKIADIFAQQVEFENAGEALATFAKDYPTDPRAVDVMLKSIQYYRNAENHDGSRVRSQEFLSLFPSHIAAVKVELEMAELLEINQEYEHAAKTFESFSAKYKDTFPDESIYARVKNAIIMLNHVNSSAGRFLLNELEPIVFNSPGMSRAKITLARQKLIDTRQKMHRILDALSIRYGNLREFNQSTDALQKVVSELQRGYLELLEIGDLETKGEGFLELGNLYDKVLKIIARGPKGSEFSPKEREEFAKIREELMTSYRKKSILSWRNGYKIAKDNPEFFDTHRKINYKLSRVEHGPFNEFNEGLLDVRFLGVRLPKNSQ